MSSIILQAPFRGLTVISFYTVPPEAVGAKITYNDVEEGHAFLDSEGGLFASSDLSTIQRWALLSALVDERRRRARRDVA